MNETISHARAVNLAHKLIDAAWQTCSQIKSTREALRKARMEERKRQDAEQKRQKKEIAAAKVREEKRIKREADKAAKAAAKAKDKKNVPVIHDDDGDHDEAAQVEDNQEEVPGEEGKEKNQKRQFRRRGKGADEVGDADPLVLRTRFPSHEAMVSESFSGWLESVVQGQVSVFRCRRSAMKKVLTESDALTESDVKAANLQLLSEQKKFLADFVALLEQNPDKTKTSRPTSEAIQMILADMALDYTIQSTVDNINSDATRDDSALPIMHIDRESFQKVLGNSLETCKSEFRGEPEQIRMQETLAAQEVLNYKQLQFVGFRHQKVWSGMFPYAHFQYQLEGSRVLAVASVHDVSWTALRNKPCDYVMLEL